MNLRSLLAQAERFAAGGQYYEAIQRARLVAKTAREQGDASLATRADEWIAEWDPIAQDDLDKAKKRGEAASARDIRQQQRS